MVGTVPNPPSVDESPPTAHPNSPVAFEAKGSRSFEKGAQGTRTKGSRVQGQRGAGYEDKGEQGTRAKGSRVTA